MCFSGFENNSISTIVPNIVLNKLNKLIFFYFLFYKEWFNNDIFLINGILSTDSTIHTISNVAIIPSVLVVSGRGPCVIDENFTELKNYVELEIEDVTFYVHCAGPTSVTITKSSFQSTLNNQDVQERHLKQKKSLETPKEREFVFFDNVRLETNYFSQLTDEKFCFSSCKNTYRCIAATFSVEIGRCFYYDSSYNKTENVEWSKGLKSIVYKKYYSITEEIEDFILENIIQSPRVTNWGDFGYWEKCLNGFAIGFMTKIESNRGSGDNTAMNAIALLCSDYLSDYSSYISSVIGPWGNWSDSYSNCGSASSPKRIKGFQLKVESYISGDNSATNGINFKCEDDTIIRNDEQIWGKFN